MNFLSFKDSTRKLAAADSVAVIGLGRFGTSLALELMETGTEVLGVDINEDIVQALNGRLTQVVRADSTKPETLEQLTIGEFDRVVVAVGSDIKVSILTASLLLQLGVPVVWAKADDEQHAIILDQLGVHRVLSPERDMGRRVAHLVRGAAADYLEIDPGYAMVKTAAPREVQGMTLREAGVRARHQITVAAYRADSGQWRNAEADTVLQAGDTVLVVGPTARVEAFAQLR
ncbi:TrkA family potassium uptake protein [Leucobacter zeae]|nr:TrkA family potassium uptake protein [Leucobacter zeae]